MSIKITTENYVRTHGRQPSRTAEGVWGFEVETNVETADGHHRRMEYVFTPRAMVFADAKAWFRRCVETRSTISVAVCA